jgi:hypothetical protein
MLMVASADAVARRAPSGENRAQVMPRAWARGRVMRDLYCRLRRARGIGDIEREEQESL